MKKLLALVLALVMSLSLVTISNAAYSDADEISYKEAAEVLSAVGVLEGNNNTFAPKDELTREMAAKIIAYLDLGKDVAEALPAIKVFNDVEADRWSAKYIAYCYDAGYLAGTGDGSFNPTGKLTGYAFGKMLLCVLGYDASTEKFTGNGWEIKVATLMKDKDIAKGVSKNGTAVLTREEGAQYALNALKAEMVEYDEKGSTIIAGDVTIINKGSSATGTGEALYEALYGDDISYDNDTEDAFGRKAVKWEYKDFEGVYTTDDADYTYYGSVSGKTLYKDLSLKSSKTYELNSKPMTGAEIKALDDDFGGYNYVVEVNYDKDEKTIEVIEVKYEIAKITKVNEVNKNRDERSVVIDGKAYETESFAKNDYVLYTYEDGEFQSVELAKSVEGKVTSVKGGKLTIDGKTYEYDKSVSSLSGITAKTEATFWLGVDGAIVFATDVDAATTSDKYAYVYKVNNPSSDVKYDEDGYEIDNGDGTAYFVDANGVKGSAVIAEDEDIKAGTVIAYTINKDGEIETAATDDVTISKKFATTIGKSLIADGEDADYLASSATKFVFVNDDNADKKLTISVSTGYKNIEDQDANVIVVYDEDNKAEVVFVLAKAETEKEDEAYAFLVDAEASVSWDEDEEDYVYTYVVLIDGEEEELSTYKTDNYMKGVEEGERFTYVLKDGMLDEAVEVQTPAVKGEIKAIVDNYVKIGSKTYEIADEAEVYNNSDADELFIGDAFEEGDVVAIYDNGKDADDDDFAYVAVVILTEAVED